MSGLRSLPPGVAESERPACECHGQPMRWHADARRKRGGWRCAEGGRKRPLAPRVCAAPGCDNTFVPNRYHPGQRFCGRTCLKQVRNSSETHREGNRRYYHAPYGGWYKRRKRHLAAQRGRILEQLDQLDALQHAERGDAVC